MVGHEVWFCGVYPIENRYPTLPPFGMHTVGAYILIGGLEHFLFFHILGRIIPTDSHIFQRGRYTTNQYKLYTWYRYINMYLESFPQYHLVMTFTVWYGKIHPFLRTVNHL